MSNNTAELPAAGGSGSLTVTAARECSWSAQPQAGWIAVAAGSGQGNGTVGYTVQPNPNGTSRHGAVIVSDKTVDVAQAAAPCQYGASPSSVEAAAPQSDVAISLTATSGCHWTARSDVPWILSVAPPDGTGSTVIHLTIAANAAEARTGNVDLGDAHVAVHQSAMGQPPPPTPSPTPEPPPPTPGPPPPACTFDVAPLGSSIGAAGGDVPVTVTAGAGCAWTATTTDAWVSITSGASGSGNATVVVAVSANSGEARAATLTIAGHAVTITQAAAAPPPPPSCDDAINPESYDAGPAADAVSVAVTAGSTCTWTATTSTPWITIDAQTVNGTGNGTVRLSIQANTGDARSGVVTIAGRPFTVRQAAACTYAIDPASFDAASEAGSTSVAVTTGATCGWSATTDAAWMSIDPQTTGGTGPGVVRLSIEANTGDARSGTATIAGQPFTVRQAGACTYTLSPDSYDAGAGTDGVSIGVTTSATCTWTATTDASWIAIDPQTANGTGNGMVRIAIQANTGDARAGTVIIGGQAFTVRQQAGSCTYEIKPGYYHSGGGADTVTIEVMTAAGCAWTAESPVSWATVTAGATGTGSGTVTVAVEANDGDARLATLTIAGQSFRLWQDGGE